MEEIRLKLTESIFEVFEKMLFVFLEPADVPGSTFDMGASIRYDSGTVSGSCRIRLPQKLAGIIAQNLHGLDKDEITGKYMEDCVKESINMICGNFLSKFDKSRIFHLSIPEVGLQCCEDTADRKNEDVYRLDFDSDYGKLGIVTTMSVRSTYP